MKGRTMVGAKWRGILAVDFVVALVVALAVSAAANSTVAWDLTWDFRHLGSVHESTNAEDYCLETSTPRNTKSFSTAKSNVEGSLWAGGASFDERWDSTSYDILTGNFRVSFSGRTSPCQQLPAAERGPIEIEYWLSDDNSWQCGSRRCNISRASTTYFDSFGHEASRYYYIYLSSEMLVDEWPGGHYYHHQVNHETGHALGFADGGGSPCPDSVMHTSAYSLACPDRHFPSPDDKTRLDYRANN